MKSHIEIHSANLIHNLKLFHEHTGKPLMFVVKANAYGHGLREVIQVTKELDYIGYYAVDSMAEALIVKEIAGEKKILVIGWADKEELEVLIRQGIEIIVPSMEYFNKVVPIAKKMGKAAKCHLKVETGTARLGMSPAEVVDILNRAHKEVEVTGIYSHFANIEDTTDHSYARSQLAIYNELLGEIDSQSLLKHFSCSASTLLFPETHFDMARVGISAYGFWPSKQTYISYIEQKGGKIELKPALGWYSRVAQVKELKQGEYIGYGLTYRTFSNTKIAVIPVGYYDGYDRKCSNMANIIIKGVKAPVRGRVCMDMFMAEVTHIPGVKEGDPVTLIGTSGNEKVTIDDLADIIGTINYEVAARINPLIPRRIVP